MTLVDTKLAQYEFKWKLNPYRIEDKNGSIIQSGPSFDLRDSTLKSQKEALVRRDNSRFKVS